MSYPLEHTGPRIPEHHTSLTWASISICMGAADRTNRQTLVVPADDLPLHQSKHQSCLSGSWPTAQYCKHRTTPASISLMEEARDIQHWLSPQLLPRTKLKDGPSTCRAAIRACKYLRAMVNQHGPLIQSAHLAAKTHTQRSKSSATATMQYRPKEGELPVIAPELTSELLHCLSTLPDPWPLAKITIDMEKPSQWVSKICRLFLQTNTPEVRWECQHQHRC